MLEIEKTYLAKELPEGLEKCRSIEVADIYVPATVIHPIVRIRKKGDIYEITKKAPVDQNDLAIQQEDTIKLTQDEYESLSKVVGKRLRKTRYSYEWNGLMCEIDVFQDDLKGLVLVDFEFDSEEKMVSFKMPLFCLAEVTGDEFPAGGMLCGKSYKDIEKDLKRFGYRKIL